MNKIPKRTPSLRVSSPKKTSDALLIIAHQDKNDAELERLKEEARNALEIGQLAYDARTAAKLTQVQLARKIKVPASVINDLEMADYPGDVYGLLRRIAQALGQQVALRPAQDQRRSA